MKAKDCSSSKIQITTGSIASEWVTRHASYLGSPLSAIQERGRPVHMFANDELLVRHDDSATIQYLISKYNATVEQPLPIPPQPKGMDPARRRSIEGMPQLARVRFHGEHIPIDTFDASSLERSGGELQVTSRAGAGTLKLAYLLAGEGRRVMLNSVGRSAALPASSAQEGLLWDGASDPYQWPEFTGSSQITRAWQLVEAYQQVRSLASPVYLGIFDNGFNLDAQGRFVDPNPDFSLFLQYNLIDEGQSAGGANNEAGKEWHGTKVLSAAAAPIGNKTGAAGSGGVFTPANTLVVVPVLFKTFMSVCEMVRGMNLAVAWGIDVINISTSTTYHGPGRPSADWDDAFQFAANQGVIVVAAAGNDAANLPDERVIVPATRTPGVVTVGALNSDLQTARGDSNYGSSVDIWASGTNIHVMPYPGAPQGAAASGTSLAAPVVAGIVSLMKAIQPNLNSGDVKHILRDYAYHPPLDRKVTAALDAYAALLHTMGDRLPPGSIEEVNNTPQSAHNILPDASGILTPIGATTLSHSDDVDWWQFNVTQYSTCLVSVNYVPELSWVTVELIPDDPDNPAPGKFVPTNLPGERRINTAIIPPGLYRVMVRGGGPNIYELKVTLTPQPLTPDVFEENDSFETATHFTLNTTPVFGIPSILQPWKPGTYDANLHVPNDVDFFHITEIPTIAIVIGVFAIRDADAPLDVTIYGPDKKEFKVANDIRTEKFSLPGPECWVRVSGRTANQYSFRIVSEENESIIPDLVDNNPLHVPHWLPDPPFRLDQWEEYLRVEITNELKQIGKLRLTGTQSLTLDVLSPATGEVLASGIKTDSSEPHAIDVDVSGLSEGTHLLRIGRDLSPGLRLNRSLSKSPVTYNIGPAW